MGGPPLPPLKGRDVVTNCILPRFFFKIPVTLPVTIRDQGRDKNKTTGPRDHRRRRGPDRVLVHFEVLLMLGRQAAGILVHTLLEEL